MTISDDQQKLQQWMEDYALYQMLDPELPAETAAGAEVDFSTEAPPEEGQIRLWPAVEMSLPPLYGLLLSAGYACWRVLPFSELAHPATPEELRLREEAPLRVLQGWNSRELTGERVKHSWCVDRLTEPEMFRVNSWWLGVEAGVPPAADLLQDCGPPLRHPLDPRHLYLEAESARADICLGERAAVYRVDEDLRRAAEPEQRYGEEKPDDDAG